VSIAGQHATHDPQLALQWSDSITDPATRTQATSQIARNWYAQDPEEATAWLYGLPQGEARDDAIMASASVRSNSRTDMDALIDSISDTNKRKSAIVSQLRSLAHLDSGEAKRRLANLELTDSERAQLSEMIDSVQYRY
jgi:signal transduction histidine kinase